MHSSIGSSRLHECRLPVISTTTPFLLEQCPQNLYSRAPDPVKSQTLNPCAQSPTDGFNCMAEITEANIEKIAWEELSGLVEKATTKVKSVFSLSQLDADSDTGASNRRLTRPWFRRAWVSTLAVDPQCSCRNPDSDTCAHIAGCRSSLQGWQGYFTSEAGDGTQVQGR
jgi:hypothetical protein